MSSPLFAAPFGSLSAPLEHTFDAVTWNFALDYTVNPGLNIYGHISRGFKEGGFNGTAPPGPLQAFSPEFVIDYEAGFKGQTHIGSWLMRYDIDGFYDDYSDIQRNQNVVVPTGNPLQPTQTLTIVENAAAGYITGAEAQLTLIPSPFFQVSANYTYMAAKYTRYNDPQGAGNVANSRFPNAPAHQLQITPMVTLPIPARVGNLTASATVYYQSSFATDAFNVPNGNPLVDLDVPGANLPGYTLVNFRIDWRHIYGSGVSAAFYVLNAFNAKYATGTDNQLNGFGFQSALYGPPMFYGFELRYEFGH
jgi:iron complex outermembrane receptor protein